MLKIVPVSSVKKILLLKTSGDDINCNIENLFLPTLFLRKLFPIPDKYLFPTKFWGFKPDIFQDELVFGLVKLTFLSPGIYFEKKVSEV